MFKRTMLARQIPESCFDPDCDLGIDHFFKQIENKKEEKTMAGTYEVFVKNGDYGYKDKTGEYGVINFSKKFDDFAEALQSFLEWTTDFADLEEEEGYNKVTLTYRRKAKK